jgi:hypothetical protein
MGEWPVVTSDGAVLARDGLPLSDRLLRAIDDWASFFDDVGGEITDVDVAHEFVGQGFKIAHALRRELKGSTVHLEHPVTGELAPIELRRNR